MKDFDKALADQDLQRRIRLERKRRDFWNDVEFFFFEFVAGAAALAMIIFMVWFMLLQ